MARTVPILWMLTLAAIAAHAQSRVKDVATVHGSRANQLIGYGVVVGLNGTGDSDAVLTRQTLSNLLRQFGLAVPPPELKARNVAVVALTATIPAFARTGSRLDVAVSSLADAKSLSGGTLLQAPLMGADGRVYAVAQGPVLVGGFFAGEDGPGGSTVARNHPTAAILPGGALVEAEIPTDLFAAGALEVVLREADFTSAVRLAGAINQEMGPLAAPLSSSTVRVLIPEEFRPPELQIEFVARVENVLFRPDVPARIVINERTGTVVANARIRIDSVAVAHGNLTISITRTPSVSQPNPFTGNGGVAVGGSGGDAAAAQGVPGSPPTPLQVGGNYVWVGPDGIEIQLPPDRQPPPGFTLRLAPPSAQPGVAAPGGLGGNASAPGGAQTVVTEQVETAVEEDRARFVVLGEMPTVADVAAALNALGVTPRDMMTIFQMMKQAGALQAELVLQ